MSFGCLSIWYCEQNYSQYQEMDFRVYGPSFWYDKEGVKKQEEEKNILLQSSPEFVDDTYSFKDGANAVYASCPVRNKVKRALEQDDFQFVINIVHNLPQIEQSFVFRYRSKKLMECDAIDGAIDAINKIPSRVQRAFAFKDLVLHLLHKGNVEKAIQVSLEITVWCVRDQVEEDISCSLRASVGNFIEEKNFFQAVKVACTIPSLERKNKTLSIVLEHITVCFLDLIKEEKFEEALYFAFQIPLECERREKIKSVFRHVGYDNVELLELVYKVSLGGYKKEFCSVLIEELQFGHAILVAHAIPQDRVKCAVFWNIAEALMQGNHVDVALLFIDKIRSEDTRVSIFYALFEALAQTYSIDTVCAIASKIPTELDKEHVFLYLSRCAMKAKFLETAIEIARRISIDPIKLTAIQHIFLILRDKGTEEQKQRVLVIARQMSSEIEKSWFLLGIVALFLEDSTYQEISKYNEIYKIACEIPLEEEKSKAIQLVFEYSVERDFLNFAIRIVETVSDPEEKIVALENLSRALVMKKYITRAIMIIQKIPDETKQSEIFKNNSYKLITENRWKAAKRMAQSIPLEIQRDIVIGRIEKKFQRKQERARLRELFK